MRQLRLMLDLARTGACMRARAAVPQLGCSIGAATLIFIPMLVSADPTLTAVLSHTASSAVACALVAVAGATYLAQRDVAPPAALAPALLASFVASSLVYALRLDVTTSIAGDALGWVSRLVAWMSLAALGPLWVFPAGGGAEGLRPPGWPSWRWWACSFSSRLGWPHMCAWLGSWLRVCLIKVAVLALW